MRLTLVPDAASCTLEASHGCRLAGSRSCLAIAAAVMDNPQWLER
jgi:hypothetical protein